MGEGEGVEEKERLRDVWTNQLPSVSFHKPSLNFMPFVEFLQIVVSGCNVSTFSQRDTHVALSDILLLPVMTCLSVTF